MFVCKVFSDHYIHPCLIFFRTQDTNSSFPDGPESSVCMTVMTCCPRGIGWVVWGTLHKMPPDSCAFGVPGSGCGVGFSPSALLSPCLFFYRQCILSPAVILSPPFPFAASSLLSGESKANIKGG